MTATGTDTEERGPISPEDVLEEITEEWDALKAEADEDEPVSFFGAVQDYYWNLFDDLHDSAGDAEYQQGVVERIAAVQQLFLPLLDKDPAVQVEQKAQVVNYLGDMLNAKASERPDDITDGVNIPEGY